MTRNVNPRTLFVSFLLLLACAPVRGWAGPVSVKIEALLVWASDDASITNKTVDPDIQKQLAKLPLRWTNYFQINRTVLTIPEGKSVKTVLSEKCATEVKNVKQASGTLQVALFGEGEQVVRRTQVLHRNQVVAFGGNAPNSTGWLVVLKRLE
jgi:hypothetical protein